MPPDAGCNSSIHPAVDDTLRVTVFVAGTVLLSSSGMWSLTSAGYEQAPRGMRHRVFVAIVPSRQRVKGR